MNLHLETISQRVTPGAHAVLELDGAGWHSSAGGWRSRQHRPAALAAILAGAEPGGERLDTTPLSMTFL